MNRFLKITSVVTLLLFLRATFALAGEQVFFYDTDPAGTPLVMTDAAGNVVWRADYQPFGEEEVTTSDVQNNRMFVGKEKDAESGLYYFGARYMDASSGRFVSPDVINAVDAATGKINQKALLNPQRLNRYAYAGNNPYKFVDPDGLDWILSQKSGRVKHIDNKTFATTDYGKKVYSGNAEGLNNFAMQDTYKKGPIVQGTYSIGDIQDIQTSEGKNLRDAMRLTPDGETEQRITNLGRDGGFIWHGDNDAKDYTASEGCPVSDKDFRKTVAKSGDKKLGNYPL